MRLTFLGTGTSHGIPVLGCDCAVCSSMDPRDNRYRSSVLIEGNDGEHILIDAGPEFRLQALRAGLHHLDAVLVSHAHADHVHGLDDVRPLCRNRQMSVWASENDAAEIRERFSYAFRAGQPGGGKPRFDLGIAPPEGVAIGRLRAIPVPLMHGDRRILGYRIGGLSYLTDCSGIPASSMPLLEGTDVLVLDALRTRPHPTHFSISEAFDVARLIAPGQLYLTHLCHDHSHQALEELCRKAGLPFPAFPAYDGLVVDVQEQVRASVLPGAPLSLEIEPRT
ncbi:MAG: MBL fold metallo-hydrolase [Spirochaetales bacterium]|nr:MAG: MBL fold metallo-hydrolase [Spirochaetales bacterium]